MACFGNHHHHHQAVIALLTVIESFEKQSKSATRAFSKQSRDDLMKIQSPKPVALSKAKPGKCVSRVKKTKTKQSHEAIYEKKQGV